MALIRYPLQPKCPFVVDPIYNTLTDSQKELVVRGWPLHAFYEPVEIIKGIWLSGVGFTDDLALWCKNHDITAILNAAGSFCRINYYKSSPDNIHYCELDIDDETTFNIVPFLEPSYEFITEHHDNILIHCVWGQSRSVSCLIYYLIKKYKLTYKEALTIIHQQRPTARPNNGFIAQLHRAMVISNKR